MKQLWILLAIIFMLYGCVILTHAQWSTDPTINNPISTASNIQKFPNIVSDEIGGAIIAWADFRNGTNTDIYAQRISANGEIQWSTNGVPICTVSGDQEGIGIAGYGSGGAIIAWGDVRSGTNADIYAQRVNENGVAQWTLDGVPISTASGHQSPLTIVSDGSGGAIITWQDQRNPSDHDIYAQRINVDGVVQWALDGVPICTASSDQWLPEITSDGNGGAIITWMDRRTYTDYDIYAQRISAGGVVLWTLDGVPILTGTYHQSHPEPKIVSDGSGGAIIVWDDFRSGTNSDIFAQRISPSGVVLWALNGMPICSEGTYQWLPGIVDDGSGGAIIAWQDSRSGSESADIYAQRINADGVVKWITDGVPISIASHQQILLNIVGDGSGGAIIVWQDFRNNTNYDIYAQRINATGDAQWTLDGVAISIANYHQANPTLTSDGTDGAIVAWQDSRGGTGQDIYAQIVRGDGSLGGKTAGTISGKVRVGTYGLQNVIVKLLDQDGNPLQDFLPITTNISGEYAFAEVPGAQEYQVLIVEPLGYTVDQNPKVITLLPGGNMLVDFILTQSVVANNARGLGYWKHQFDVYVTNQGNAQETQQSLTDYIIGVHEHYTPHFSLFDGLMTFAEWHDILTMRNSAPMLERARGHVATLVLNLASLKIGQYTTVTLDGKTAGDVLTYSSILLTDTDPSNDQLAKNLAEKVNNHAQIESGIVPSGSVLYKGSWAENVNQTFDASHDFSLYDNYPNPFNPVTNFRIKIPHKSFVKLEIFNSLGQQLSTIIDEEKEAGNYEVSWNASGLTSGVYFYKLTSGTFSETKKLILLK